MQKSLSVVALRSATVVDIMVSPGQRMEQSASLIKLAQLSPLWVEIAIPASNIRAIRPGAKVEVDGYATPGQVVLVSETADAATQTVLVRAEVPNTGELRPGQTAQARIGFVSSAESGSRLRRLHRAARHRRAERRRAGVLFQSVARPWAAEGRIVVEGAKRKLRPILMTASITALGLIPLLFATGPGSEIQRPLAVVVIGGLVSSTALTLILLPILHRRFGGVAKEAK